MSKHLYLCLLVVLTIAVSSCQQATTHVEETNHSKKTTNKVTNKATDKMVNKTNYVMSEEEIEVVNQMQWINSADAEADAKKALQNNVPELLAFSGRGISFPGLTHPQYESIKDKVNYRVAKGSGDVLYGETHRMLRVKLKSYAKTYNTIIFNTLNE